ncbi:MAG: NADH-quinone oxidoreductase subunit I [bacterium]|nr:NADH-quinone oxidoreductase subunit I [bacterium]
MSTYFRNIYSTIRTVLIGMHITLRYCFAKTICVQYPDVAPTIQPRFRGFHWFEVQKCIACDQCAKACPVDCIYIEKTAARKLDKASGVAMGGAMVRYAIDYSKCMFCGLCTSPCPTECIHMGNLHDLSGYDRESMIVEFVELAKQGLQTPQPAWMHGVNRTNQLGAYGEQIPEWAAQTKVAWEESARPHREVMLKAMTEQKPPPKPKPAKPAAGTDETPPTKAGS